MGFSEAVRCCLQQKYATFQGRASRSEYWWFFLFYFLGALVLFVLLFAFGGMQSLQNGDFAGLPTVPLILIALFFLGMIIPMTAATVRRFHDRNLSGWWYLASILAGFIPIVGFAASIAALVITIMKGNPGPNKFGRDPLGPDTNADVFA